MALVYLILGGNSADKSEKLLQAIALLFSELGEIKQTSSIYETEAWGYESANSYLNQALCIETSYSPLEVLHITQEIEKELGRTSKTTNGVYTDRPIDIDILFYDQEVVNLPELTIPHPHICERHFVLEPLNEICPKFNHPIRKETVKQLLDQCEDELAVKKL